MDQIREWDVTVEFAATTDPFDSSTEAADKLLKATEKFDGVVAIDPSRAAFDLTVPGTVEDAVNSAIRCAYDSMNRVGASAFHVSRLEIIDAERALREIDEPTYPRILGVAEVAEVLAVSKQRVNELRESGRLPQPLTELRSGPVWPAPTIDRFLEEWDRRPGRPRKRETA